MITRQNAKYAVSFQKVRALIVLYIFIAVVVPIIYNYIGCLLREMSYMRHYEMGKNAEARRLAINWETRCVQSASKLSD